MATVLVVDDDPAFLALAARVVEAMGAVVVAKVEDVDTAVAAADAQRPDAVLIDVGVQDGGGIELAYMLAARPWSPRVVLISSDSDAGCVVTVAADGRPVVPFVPKEDLVGETLSRLLLAHDAP